MAKPTPTNAADKLAKLAASYDYKYATANHFNYRPWLYRPFVRALVRKAGLQKGRKLLDAGCGQGFFTSLFAECGLDALGVDISVQGIKQATANHGHGGARFVVGDVCNLPYAGAFDCVYTRSCSLYNESNFAEDRHITEALLKYVKPGGVLIFDYYTNLCARKKSEAWIYHTMAATKQHFAHYSGSKVFFSLRLDAVVLGSFAFSLSSANAMASRITGLGGDLIAIVHKC